MRRVRATTNDATGDASPPIRSTDQPANDASAVLGAYSGEIGSRAERERPTLPRVQIRVVLLEEPALLLWKRRELSLLPPRVLGFHGGVDLAEQPADRVEVALLASCAERRRSLGTGPPRDYSFGVVDPLFPVPCVFEALGIGRY